MADQDSRPAVRGDEAELFRTYSDELLRTVAGAVGYSDWQIVEDARPFAWAQFLRVQPDRQRNWQAWLFRTAQREAWELEGLANDHDPLRVRGEVDGSRTPEPQAREDLFQRRLDLDDALKVLSGLSPRLRRIALLRRLGLRLREIGEITGDSTTRVSQLVSIANTRINDAVVELRRDRPLSPRAERLWQLEHHTPVWLAEKIGYTPAPGNRKLAGQSLKRRAWRRAALALDDYRRLAGPMSSVR